MLYIPISILPIVDLNGIPKQETAAVKQLGLCAPFLSSSSPRPGWQCALQLAGDMESIRWSGSRQHLYDTWPLERCRSGGRGERENSKWCCSGGFNHLRLCVFRPMTFSVQASLGSFSSVRASWSVSQRFFVVFFFFVFSFSPSLSGCRSAGFLDLFTCSRHHDGDLFLGFFWLV